MRTYLVCDQDGFIVENIEGSTVQHFIDNPTHTAHVGVGGDSSVPTTYAAGSSGTISEVETDPALPVAGQIWLKVNGAIGVAGQAMGVMGLTYTKKEVDNYDLSMKTSAGQIVRLRME